MSSLQVSKVALGSFALLFLLFASPSFFAANASYGSPSSSAMSIQTVQPILAYTAASPTCSPSALCPSMMDNAYGLTALHNKGVTGKGQAVVIVDACGDPSIASDLKTFDSTFKLPNPKLNIYYPQGKNVCVNSLWSVETSIDVEWAHTVAPGATISLVISRTSSGDLFGSWVYALIYHLGNEISNSWGGPGYCKTGSNLGQIVNQANRAGVTILASSGDSGWWGNGTNNKVQLPADCQGVLTVGGTTLTVSSSGKYMGESAWGGSGGGYVTKAHEPTYQSSVKINDKFNELGKPDVSADANPYTGVWVYNSGGWSVWGGTSVACPLWAGFLADVNQIRSSHGYSPAGLVAPFLYEKVYGVSGKSSLYGKDFHDITTGSNGWPAGKGWDPVTGLGSFIAPTLAETLGSNEAA